MGPGEFIFNQIIVPGAVNLASNALYGTLADKSEPVIVNQVEIAYEGSGDNTSLRIRASGNVKSTKVIGQGPVVAAEVEFSDFKVRVAAGKRGSVTEIGPTIPPQPLTGNIIETKSSSRKLMLDGDYRTLPPTTYDDFKKWRQQRGRESSTQDVSFPPVYNFDDDDVLAPSPRTKPHHQPPKTYFEEPKISFGDQEGTTPKATPQTDYSSSYSLYRESKSPFEKTQYAPRKFHQTSLPKDTEQSIYRILDTSSLTSSQIDTLIQFRKPVDFTITPPANVESNKEEIKKPVNISLAPKLSFPIKVESKEQKVEFDLPALDKDAKSILNKLNRALKGEKDGDRVIAILDALKRNVAKLEHSQRLSLVDHLGYKNPHLPWWVWPRILVIWGEYCSSK